MIEVGKKYIFVIKTAFGDQKVIGKVTKAINIMGGQPHEKMVTLNDAILTCEDLRTLLANGQNLPTLYTILGDNVDLYDFYMTIPWGA